MASFPSAGGDPASGTQPPAGGTYLNTCQRAEKGPVFAETRICPLPCLPHKEVLLSALVANLTGNVNTHPSRAALPPSLRTPGPPLGQAAALAEATDEHPGDTALLQGPQPQNKKGEKSDLPRSVCCCCHHGLVLPELVCKPNIPHRHSLTRYGLPGGKHHSSGDLTKGGIYSCLQPDRHLTEGKTEKHAEIKESA